MITFLLRVRQTERYNCWQWVLARVLASNIDPRSISTRIVTINKIDSYLFKGQFSQQSVQYSRFAIWLVLQTASKPHSYICIDRVILRTRSQRSNMTNLQHVALFMFLIFLPKGRDRVVLLLVSQCHALSIHLIYLTIVSLSWRSSLKNQNLINLGFHDDESSFKWFYLISNWIMSCLLQHC